MSVLTARDITVSAKLGDDLVPVLRDFSLALEPGRVLGLVGESGAGKSMVGRTVAQMLAAWICGHGRLAAVRRA